MSKPNDDLEAVRIIAEALKDFEKSDQERIIRWARERVGLDVSGTATLPTAQSKLVSDASPFTDSKSTSIREFIEAKAPKRDIHFAATVAYFYRFEAPEGSKKDVITSDDLQEACRLSNKTRFKKPIGVLNNAEAMGLLDRPERGQFKINAVGENLVAMGLPGGNSGNFPRQRKTRKNKKRSKK